LIQSDWLKLYEKTTNFNLKASEETIKEIQALIELEKDELKNIIKLDTIQELNFDLELKK